MQLTIKNMLYISIGLFFQVVGIAADTYCYYNDGSYTCSYEEYSISAGTLIGIIIGCLVIVVKIIIIVACCVRRKNRYVQRGTVIYGSPVGAPTTGVGHGVQHPPGTTNSYNQYGTAPPAYSTIYHTPQGQTNQAYQEK